MNLFGFQFPFSKEQKKEQESRQSFAPPAFDDGAITIENARGIGGSHFSSQYVDIDGSYKNDTDLVVRYRSMSIHPEIDTAIEEITNEAIVTDEVEEPVKLIMDQLDYSESTKHKIYREFDTILGLLNFRTKGYDYFRRWYIDARCYFHTIIDEKNPEDGIKEIRYIDPLNMKKVREIEKKLDPNGIEVITIKNEFYVYNKTIIDTSLPQVNRGTGISISGIKISPDVIVYVTSGLYDPQKKLVFGYLHKAIRPLNQLKMMEDSVVIYRLARAPERRAFYIDVGNLPKAKAEQYMKELINRYRNKLSYDANTGEVRDERRYLSVLEDYWLPRREGGKGTEINTLPGACLAMDTKVPLLDGRELTISQITEEMNSGKKLWAYSCDEVTGEVKPGIITWAGVTQKSAKVMKITFDNGKHIICTPDHKFPVYGVGFVRADELSTGSSLIPFYSQKKTIGGNKKKDYEMVYDNATKQWVYTHSMVASFFKNTEVHDFIYNESYAEYNKNVIHHKDHDRFNNTPENLCYMSWDDHSVYHTDHSFGIENAKLGAAALRQKIEYMKNNDPENYAAYCEKVSCSLKDSWNSKSEEEKQSIISSRKDGILCFIIDNIKGKSTHEVTIKDVVSLLNESDAMRSCLNKLNESKTVPNWNISDGFSPTIIKSAIKEFGYSSWTELRKQHSLHNHRIVSIEYIADPIEVGTLTIDGNEIYHNHHTFALSCGVFTKNSNIGEISDINYFLRKLSKALNIPYSRVENEQKSFQIGRSMEISRDEIKFAKFIERLRTKFSEVFYELLKKQLLLKGIMTEDEWEDTFKKKAHFHFAHDMYFSELKELEVENERLNSLTAISPFIGTFYSKEWVRKNILRQNDADIELMDLQMEEENLKDEQNQIDQEERDDAFGLDNNFDSPIQGGEQPYDGFPPGQEDTLDPQLDPNVNVPTNKYGNKKGNFPRF
jgi:hypothetical protein